MKIIKYIISRILEEEEAYIHKISFYKFSLKITKITLIFLNRIIYF